jgi:potassium efflux system protein
LAGPGVGVEGVPATASPVPAEVTAPAAASELGEAPGTITQLDIDALTKRIEAATELNDERRKEALERLKSATEWLKTLAEAEAKAVKYQQDIESTPGELEEARVALATPLAEPTFELPGDVTLAQVEQLSAEADARLEESRNSLAKREELHRVRNERKTQLAKLIAEIDGRLDEARKLMSSCVDRSQLDGVARFAECQARHLALKKQKVVFPIELRRIEVRSELLPLQRDLAKRAVAHLEKETARWHELVGEYRKRELDRQAAETLRQVQNAHPALKQLAQANALYTEQRKSLRASIEKVEKEVQQSKQIAQRLKESFAKVSEKVEKVGQSTTIGFLLRREREHLPDVSHCREQLRFVREATPNIHLAALNLQDERDLLGNLDAAVAHFIAGFAGQVRQQDQPYVTRMASELHQTRRDVLDKLIGDHDQYIRVLDELELAQRDLLAQREQFETYIDQRVLWIRSSEPIWRADIREALAGLQSLMSPTGWLEVGQAIRRRAAEQPWLVLLATVIAGLMVLLGHDLRRYVQRLRDASESDLQSGFGPTLKALVAMTLLAGIWAGVMWLVGWQLVEIRGMPELGRACGVGLQSTAFAYWIAQTVRRLCRRGGLGERHLQWSPDRVASVRTHVAWLTLLGVPVVFFVSALTQYEGGQWNATLGRIAFLAGCLLLALFSHAVLRPDHESTTKPIDATALPVRSRGRHALRCVGIVVPLSLALLASLGYGYSAERLAARFQATAAVILSVMLLRTVVLRWLSLRMQRLLSQVEGVEVGAASSSDATLAGSPSPEPLSGLSVRSDSPTTEGGLGPDDEEPLVAAASPAEIEAERTAAQIRYLLRYAVAALLLVGGYWIWSDVTPALGVLDEVQLWSRYVDVQESVPDADGTLRILTTQKEVATTLKHALLAVVIVIVGFVLARNVPALLEILVLEHVPCDKGQRYAAGMILRYLITMTGVMIACREMGLTWSSIQWLAAAMTVGLGFGLQEIFANLVSGLIILFERPVRVGDLVTAGGVTGRVTRMQIRATTITDFDRRELIVPNKKFITDDVMNWTLSDNVNRVVIEVGIAYGSDTARARQLLLRVAQRNPLVLKDPAPSATFDKFAASSLNLTLRCFLPDLDNRLAVIHDLHSAIDREFRQAKIEIAFPQQDLHLRSIDGPLREILQRDTPQSKVA